MTTAATSFEQPRMEIGSEAPSLHGALVALGNDVKLDPRLRGIVQKMGDQAQKLFREATELYLSEDGLATVTDAGYVALPDDRLQATRDAWAGR